MFYINMKKNKKNYIHSFQNVLLNLKNIELIGFNLISFSIPIYLNLKEMIYADLVKKLH